MSSIINKKGVIILLFAVKGFIFDTKSYKLNVMIGVYQLNSSYELVFWRVLKFGVISLLIHNVII